MLGLLVIMVVSWGLLYFIEKEHINVLGFLPPVNKIFQFFTGLILIAIIVSINIHIAAIFEKTQWVTTQVDYSMLWNAFVYHLRSALTEDLVFRGAILYILIKRIGATKAILISAAFFGLFHWFSYGILNERWILLAYVFVVTGFTGYVWAYTFHKTKSIMLALGFHVGYNLTMSCFFEAQPYGNLFFSVTSKIDLVGWNEFYLSMFSGLFPSIVTLATVKLLLKTKFFQPTLEEEVS